VISPLLANLYLHWLDRRFHGQDGPARFAKARIVRYADDFVILARYVGTRITRWVEGTVEDWMGLRVNREKTSVIDLKQPGAKLDFLGYSLCYKRSNYDTGQPYLSIEPSAKACAREREAVRGIVNGHRTHVPLADMIETLNRQLAGWKNYFNRFHRGLHFAKMNRFVCHRVVRHLMRRSQRPFRPPEGETWYGLAYKRLGLLRL